MPPIIQVSGLCKEFRVPVRESGLRAALKSLYDRRTRTVRAVADVSFALEQGETVGFLGPNGAGKTTTLKMLTGLLHPTAGAATVNGFVPWERKKDYLRTISMVMGNRHQLNWDLPAIDSFRLHRIIYDVPERRFRATLDELVALLDLAGLLDKPVRNLSLGERMKCEFAGALLHRPQVMFLDEPTLGLDVTMQRRIRAFLREYNRVHGATVLLTSHYMADIAALCPRVIVIHEGRMLFAGTLKQLVARYAPTKLLTFELDVADADLRDVGRVIAQDGFQYRLEVAKDRTPEVAAQVLARFNVTDLSVEDPPIEQVIAHVFAVS